MRSPREVMTTSPRTVTPGTSLAEAARVMAEDDIGDVLVAESKTERLVGIVTTGISPSAPWRRAATPTRPR